MLVARGGLRGGETVLIVAAGSGIGTAAVQIAKLFGANVIATAGGREKTEKVKKLGPDYVIDHRSDDIFGMVMDITGGGGVDLVFEHVGPATFDKSLRSLKKNGRLVICGATSGPEAMLDLRYLFSRQLSIMGSMLGTRQELLKITELVAEGGLEPVIDEIFPLEKAAEAHRKMEESRHVGKIILRV
jgi:NADPH:quinone reductase-like Zn-dependent oxidoreductase